MAATTRINYAWCKRRASAWRSESGSGEKIMWRRKNIMKMAKAKKHNRRRRHQRNRRRRKSDISISNSGGEMISAGGVIIENHGVTAAMAYQYGAAALIK